MQVELFNALQLILIITVILTATCYIVHSLKFSRYLLADVIRYSEVKSGLSYSKELTVVECESYHRYQIWRFYLFS